MSTKARLVYRSREDKYAELRPKNPNIVKKLKENTGKDFMIVSSDYYVSFDLLCRMIDLELYDLPVIEDPDNPEVKHVNKEAEQKRDALLEEKSAVLEGKLLHMIYSALGESESEEDRKAWEIFNKHLEGLKLLEAIKFRAKKKERE